MGVRRSGRNCWRIITKRQEAERSSAGGIEKEFYATIAPDGHVRVFEFLHRDRDAIFVSNGDERLRPAKRRTVGLDARLPRREKRKNCRVYVIMNCNKSFLL